MMETMITIGPAEVLLLLAALAYFYPPTFWPFRRRD
jgi:hypothetical protein